MGDQMHDETESLPVHPVTGLPALGIVGGRPVWPVLGAAPEDQDGDSDGDGTGDGSDSGDGQEGGTGGAGEDDGDGGEQDGEDGEAALGEPGKKALTATKEKWRKERDRRRKAEKELAEARKGHKSNDGDGDGSDPEQVRAEAEQAATAKANARIVKAELKASAAGKLADPADATAFIDTSDFEVDEDGRVDEDELTEAISDLLKRKPHLAAGTTQRKFQGGGDGGAGRGSKPKALADQIREAEAAGDIDRSLALKEQLLQQQAK